MRCVRSRRRRAVGNLWVFAQSADPNSAPNPYKMEDNWAKLPDGRKMGAPIGVEVDRDGKSVWVFVAAAPMIAASRTSRRS